MKQPSKKIEGQQVPKLYFSQTKVDSQNNREKSPGLILSAEKTRMKQVSS